MINLVGPFLFLIVAASCSTRTSFPKEIGDIMTRCDSLTVYLAIIESQKLQNDFPDDVFDRFLDRKEHTFYNDDSTTKADLDDKIAIYFKNAIDKKSIIQTLNKWCDANRFFIELGGVGDSLPPEAVLYNDKTTERIVKKHLTLPTQDWGSLSTFQLFEVNVDFMKFAETLSDGERQKIFAQLQQAARKTHHDQ